MDEYTLDGRFNSIFIDYHSNKISHEKAMGRMIIKAGDEIQHESHPCAYVPWGQREVKFPVTNKKERTFKFLGSIHSTFD